MGLFFNRDCDRCGKARGCCPHTNPNLNETTREKHADLLERRIYSSSQTSRKTARRLKK